MTSIKGLYAITPEIADTEILAAKVELAIEGGAALVQYRTKRWDDNLRLEQARALRWLCKVNGVPFIVNDDVELAVLCQADGVHLGKDDTSVRAARMALGPSAIIGVSCYDKLPLALAARQQGADYVAFGSFFPSFTKPHTVRPRFALLDEAKHKLGMPVVAIGGISHENAGSVIASGADCIAVISALFDAADVGASARRFAALFEERTLDAFAQRTTV
jgi:thiamine-phosphate pyrophosphorylase